jgi:hypothetical protein
MVKRKGRNKYSICFISFLISSHRIISDCKCVQSVTQLQFTLRIAIYSKNCNQLSNDKNSYKQIILALVGPLLAIISAYKRL